MKVLNIERTLIFIFNLNLSFIKNNKNLYGWCQFNHNCDENIDPSNSSWNVFCFKNDEIINHSELYVI
jgi:hypothetical protein